MVNKNHIDAFVNNMLSIRADLILEKMEVDEKHATAIKMAADSPRALTLTVSPIGSLSDPDNQMLVRVYRDEVEHCFRLYLLSSTGQEAASILLTIPEKPHFFVADADGQITIPYSLNVDPLNSIFHLNFPIQTFEMDRIPELNQSLNTDVFRLHFDETISQLSIEIFQAEPIDEKLPTKLVIDAMNQNRPIVRLIPIRDHRAVIYLEGITADIRDITLSTFA